jgi:hypothetical protein
MTFVLYCLSVYFVFYVFNCSDIAEKARVLAAARLPSGIVYALNCALCSTWWVTLGAAILCFVPPSWAMAAPVVNLAIHKTLTKLSS